MSKYPLTEGLGLVAHPYGLGEHMVYAYELERTLARGVRVKAQQLKESGLTDEHGPGWMAHRRKLRPTANS